MQGDVALRKRQVRYGTERVEPQRAGRGAEPLHRQDRGRNRCIPADTRSVCSPPPPLREGGYAPHEPPPLAGALPLWAEDTAVGARACSTHRGTRGVFHRGERGSGGKGEGTDQVASEVPGLRCGPAEGGTHRATRGRACCGPPERGIGRYVGRCCPAGKRRVRYEIFRCFGRLRH